jgi:membrane protein YdbS with pleckstrin-like domain
MFCAEQIQAQAVLCRFCGRDQVDKNAEVIRFDGSPSHSAYFGEYVLYGLLSLLVIGLPFLIHRILKTKSEKWRISSRRVQRQTGIVSTQIGSIELWRVRDIQYQQTFMERILGVGTILLLSTDASDPVLSLRGLPEPLALYEWLKSQIETARREHRVMTVDQ